MLRLAASLPSLLAALSPPPPPNVRIPSAPALPEAASAQRVVVMSPFRDIYTNLAIEEALLAAVGFRSVAPKKGAPRVAPTPGFDPPLEGLLLCYRNDPCVVIGSNQNPWAECAVPHIAADPVRLARRQSGGGTVYHDEGNACFSFLCHRADYDPEANTARLMEFLQQREPSSVVTTTDRHDVFIGGRKVTGSAMRLVKATSYHHCTLLCDSDPAMLGRYLRPAAPPDSITESSSVGSVRSPVTTLAQCGFSLPAGAPGAVADGVTGAFAEFYAAGSRAVTVTLAGDGVDDVHFVDRTARLPKLNTVGAVAAASREPKYVLGKTLRFTSTVTVDVGHLVSAGSGRLVVKAVVFRGVVESATVTAAPGAGLEGAAAALSASLLGTVVYDAASVAEATQRMVTALGLTETTCFASSPAAVANEIVRAWCAAAGWCA